MVWRVIVSVQVALSHLVAHNRIGIKVKSHFQHKSNGTCINAGETILHILAKEIIAEALHVKMPDIILNDFKPIASYYSPGSELTEFTFRPVDIKLDKVYVEAIENDLQPDIVGLIDDKKIYIEIAVSHFVDAEKKKKIINRAIPTLEIDLSNVDRAILKSDLSRIVIDDISNKRWIYNPKLPSRYQKAAEKHTTISTFVSKNSKEKTIYGKKEVVYKCPLTKEDVNFMDNCSSCNFLVSARKPSPYQDFDRQDKNPLGGRIECIGHVSELFLQLVTTINNG